jgi:undecaprenyl diphosphate synthase
MTEPRIYTSHQTAALDKDLIPKHVAIIPDGNRRWAKQQRIPFDKGHRKGANVLIDTVKAAKELGIQALTFYLFSTENWTRSQEEITTLMILLVDFLKEQCETMKENGVKMQTIGDLTRLPKSALQVVMETKKATSHCDQFDLVLALNYGSRNEIQRALKKIIDDCKTQKINGEEITETLISQYLDTAKWVDPDLLIRTGGEMRISNFLLWQISYAEIYVTNVFWPDFKPIDLLDALLNFQGRERRLGGA